MKPQPLYRCTICGREGSVGRCCGNDTRIPLNYQASKEQIKASYQESNWIKLIKAIFSLF